jgi:hypothetical protein
VCQLRLQLPPTYTGALGRSSLLQEGAIVVIIVRVSPVHASALGLRGRADVRAAQQQRYAVFHRAVWDYVSP